MLHCNCTTSHFMATGCLQKVWSASSVVTCIRHLVLRWMYLILSPPWPTMYFTLLAGSCSSRSGSSSLSLSGANSSSNLGMVGCLPSCKQACSQGQDITDRPLFFHCQCQEPIVHPIWVWWVACHPASKHAHKAKTLETDCSLHCCCQEPIVHPDWEW